MDLGPGILKGNVLERTGPKRYKLGLGPRLSSLELRKGSQIILFFYLVFQHTVV